MLVSSQRPSGLCGAERIGRGIEHQLRLTKRELPGIETTAIDIVAHFAIAVGHLVLTFDAVTVVGVEGIGLLIGEAGRAVIEPLAIGRPGGESLEQIGLVADGDNTLVICVVEYQSALGVLHFRFGQTIGVKLHEGLVHRIGDER